MKKCMFYGGRAIGLVAAMVLSAGPVLAATFYVDPSGSNFTGDGSSGSPWKTLSRACAQARAQGDVITVRAGTYTDNSQCDLAIGVSVIGAGKDVTSINTTQSRYILAGSNPTGSTVDGNNTISGLTLNGQNAATEGITSYGRNNQVIHDCAFLNFTSRGMAVFGKYGFNGQGGFWKSSCNGSESTGVWCDSDITQNRPPAAGEWATGVQVFNNTFINCKLYPAALEGALIHDNTINNADSGIGHTGFWYKGCKIYGNTITLANVGWSSIAIELWELSEDTEVYDNVVNSWISLGVNTRGNTSSPYSLRVHGNRIDSSISSGDKMPALEIVTHISDVLIHNNYIHGPNAFSAGMGIWGKGTVRNITIRHNAIHGVAGDGIMINSNVLNPLSDIDDVFVYNNIIELSGGTAITCWQNVPSGHIDGVIAMNNVIVSANYAMVSGGGTNIGTTKGCEFRNNICNVALDIVPGWGTVGLTESDNVSGNAELLNTGARPNPYYEPASANANVVNAGLDVGVSFLGSAPDLGMFEWADDVPSPPESLRAN